MTAIECYGCGCSIPHGEPYMNVTYSLEHSTAAGVIEVEQAESLLSLCQDCAPSREAVASALREQGMPVP